MSRSFAGFVASMAVVFGCAGCGPHPMKMDAQGNQLPTYTGMVMEYSPGTAHFEPSGQAGWVNLTKARPGEMAEPKAIDLSGEVGKPLTVQGLLMPGTGWIYEAEIVQQK